MGPTHLTELTWSLVCLQLQSWEKSTTEPIHIYSQFAALIRARLSFRHQKHVQYELVQEALETQKDKLVMLEGAEREAKRLEEALERGGKGLSNPQEEQSEREREAERVERTQRASRLAGGSFGLLNAVKHSLSGMMDVDPEATRRANIGKTRDNIAQVGDRSLAKHHWPTLLCSAADPA